MNIPLHESIVKTSLASLIVAGLMLAANVQAEQIRFICSGTHVEYDGWGKRVEQMSSLKEDPVDLMVDTTAGKIYFSTMYGGPVTAQLKTSAEWFEGEVAMDKTVMGRKIAIVSVKVGRIAWGAMTVYTLDGKDGENHLAYAGVCTPKTVS
jgi:hypothetical protein